MVSTNKIARARLSEADADRRIAEGVGHFRAAGRPFAWWVGPCSRPLDLERRLERHGLRAAKFELGMAAELARLPERIDLPAGLEVRRVRTQEELADFAGGPGAELAFFESATDLPARHRPGDDVGGGGSGTAAGGGHGDVAGVGTGENGLCAAGV